MSHRKEAHVLHFTPDGAGAGLYTEAIDLPNPQQLGEVLDGIVESAQLAKVEGPAREAALEAASGLTTVEAENAFALSVIETGGISPAIIAREKANSLKQSGLLEVVNVPVTLEDIGGLDALKGWLVQRRAAFTRKARDYGLPVPKGMLVLGVPGTGKSLTAKATASVLGIPLLKLDAGRLFGSLVGQSEANLRQAIQTAEAFAPCVLWIDELEKALPAPVHRAEPMAAPRPESSGACSAGCRRRPHRCSS